MGNKSSIGGFEALPKDFIGKLKHIIINKILINFIFPIIIVNKSCFEKLKLIGTGNSSNVYHIINRKFKKEFAMKEISKCELIDQHYSSDIINERDLLSKMNHPFIDKLNFSFQDKDYLYMVYDLMPGGDLRYWYTQQKKFNEEKCKFIVSCLILSLEYLHSNKIIHRDIKPENIMFDKDGYIHLTDFGIARLLDKEPDESIVDTSGTPGYMAPEAIFSQRHSYSSDFFSLGILCYEMLQRKRPYFGENRQKIKEKMEAEEVQIKLNEAKENWSPEAISFINLLIKKNPEERLGYNGIEELKSHPWFKYYDWKGLYLKKIKAPFIPPENTVCFNKQLVSQKKKISDAKEQRLKKIKEDANYKNAFNDFLYFNRYSSSNNKEMPLNYVNPHLIIEEIEKKESLFLEILKRSQNNIVKNKVLIKKRYYSPSPLIIPIEKPEENRKKSFNNEEMNARKMPASNKMVIMEKKNSKNEF